MAARRDRVPQAPQHGDRVGHVEEQQPGVDQVEGRAWDRIVALEVDGRERALAMAGGVQHVHRLRAEGGVDVDADDLSGRSDALCQLSHRLARAAAGVQAAGAAGELDLVEQPSGGLRPDAGLRPQALVFLLGAPEHVVVVPGRRARRHFVRGGGHGSHGRRRGAGAHRGSDHDLSPGRWTREGAGRTVGACATRCSIAMPSSPLWPIGSARREPELVA